MTDKYRGKKTIKNWGKPAIWLNNADPRDDLPQWKVNWLNANCTFVYLDHFIWAPEEPDVMAVDAPPLSPLDPLTPTPIPTPPTPPNIRMYIDQAAQLVGEEPFYGGQEEYTEAVRERALYLHQRAAFNGKDYIQIDDEAFNLAAERWMAEVDNLLTT